MQRVREQLTDTLQANTRLEGEVKDLREQLRHQSAALQGEATTDARLNSLLDRNGQLEQRISQLQTERNTLTRERDAAKLEAVNATKTAQVKESATRRMEGELRTLRGQLTATRDDLSQRAQEDRVTRLQLEQLQEEKESLALTLAELQDHALDQTAALSLATQLNVLWEAKANSVALTVGEWSTARTHAYDSLLHASVLERRKLHARCDLISRKTEEAIVEGEKQMGAYQTALEEAKQEQQELRVIIERLEKDLNEAAETMAAATTETQAARAEMNQVRRQAHETVFEAERNDRRRSYSWQR
ncbi:hypothetical protein AGDE_16886 [Angomonas deanei]|uniref:Uncharacterized protein n=1 Tax=Angomonas deanei TaxID=59799 RepID=A0A7G2CNF2_9TRYP|nr:hypothetical protein AGDE_16886 [Angomonas deanei]CAD2220985.1 hypothetical protein, conserved [Angomonas deanei]|eukprot:EPY15974.1 hypothetical protein AGDE_16886 [Angomonas deanei]